MKDLRKNILLQDAIIKDVLTVLNAGTFGIVFITDAVGTVQGIFTDGDVRRAILKGAHLNSPACEHMQRKFVYALAGKSREIYMDKLTDTVRHLPILDDHGRLVDFISLAELWRMPVMKPHLGGNELKYVTDCIATNWISSQGTYVRTFEREFALYANTRYALTTSNCTTALHLALLGFDVGPGDEVLVPDATFAATANAVIHAGATPVFVDVSADTWTLDPERCREAITPRTKAIIPVHLYGHPCDMDPLMELARTHGLVVIEDCAEALGARYKGRSVGSIGDAGCFSFFSNKIITTGEGGMITTSNTQAMERMNILRDHGMSPTQRYIHEAVGFNYRMTNLQAAVGLAQLEQVDKFLTLRQHLADNYARLLRGIDGLTLQPRAPWAQSICWLFTVLVEDNFPLHRDALMRWLDREGVESRPFFPPLHSQPVFAGMSPVQPVSQKLSQRGVSLPSSNTLTAEEVERVCRSVRDSVAYHNTLDLLEEFI